MQLSVERILGICEGLFTVLREKSIAEIESVFLHFVVSYAEDERPHGYLRYSYALEIDRQLAPLL